MINEACYSEELLIARINDGDEACFTALYTRYWKQMFYQAEAILGGELLAQDCVQEVFTSVWKRRGQLTMTSAEAYLKTAVRFQAISIIRSRKLQRHYFERIARITSALVVSQPMLFKEIETLYVEVLHTMPSDQQEIFKLIREEGHSYKEVAELKGISVKTVEKKMSLSLKRLRLELGDFLQLFL